MTCKLIPLHNHVLQVLLYGGDSHGPRCLHIVQDTVSDIDIVSIRHQQCVQCRLCDVIAVGVFAGFDLEWDRQNTFIFAVEHRHLNGGINVTFQAIHRRPNVLLDVQEFCDSHIGFLPTPVLDSRFLLRWAIR